MTDISRRNFLGEALRSGVALPASVAVAGSALGQTLTSSKPENRKTKPARRESHDVVVYGATSPGVMAAIAAGLEGRSVALVEPGRHVGGMVSGGLGHTDKRGQERVIGGLALQFFKRVGKHYGEEITWSFEPKVAERVFRDWLKEVGVEVYYEQPMVSIEKTDASIARLHTADSTFAGKVFLDCTYEGDLMRAAGVRYAVGREGRDKYDESLAGRREILPGHHQAIVPVVAASKDGDLPPYVVRQEDLAPLGVGDGKFQGYCFRLCLSSDPDNRLPVPQPEGYNPATYALARNYLKAGGDALHLHHFLCLYPLPNKKCDVNSCGFVSTNLLSAGWAYPEATPADRKEIWEDHRLWAHGLVYFLANDPAVPPVIRDEMAQWGLPKDEFLDTGHWPHQLYIREGRRMLGEYVLTQHDLQKHVRKDDCIGLGGYNIDIREVEWVACEISRFPKVQEEVLQEGYLSYPVKPYDIPYRCLLPKQAECDNLLVPMCASMSTLAYGSYRMEPNYMLIGHAAGTAAALAVKSDAPVHKVSIAALQKRLREQGQKLK